MKWLPRKTTSQASILKKTDRSYDVPDYRDSPHYRGDVNEALRYLAASLGVNDDYMVRVLNVAGHSAACCFIHTLTDKQRLQDNLDALHSHQYPKKSPKQLAHYLLERVLPNAETVYLTNMYEIAETIVAGDAVLFVDGFTPAIVIGTRFVEHRSPEQPLVESSSRGSQVSFVENVNVNIGLIRNALRTSSLQVKKIKVGHRGNTEVAIIYIEDVANPELIQTVSQRIAAVHIDFIDQSAELEKRIVDNHWTPFPLTRITQRIDSTVREINQGKVAVLVDTDPTCLLLPATLQDFFQTEEDYASSWVEATYIRWLRFVAFVFAVFLPGLYISFVDFNPELLPKILSGQIAKSREGVPFPAVIEVVMMQIVVEILREATLRMPKQMGQTLGIVGGLVLGEASVQAGLVSNILIIVVALTAISVFVTPSYEFTTVMRLASWFMVVMATIFGLYGIVLGAMVIMYHLATLKSFGLSYLDPFNGEHIKDVFRDAIVRVPIWALPNRASHLHPLDPTGEARYVNPVPHPQLETGLPKSNRGRGGRR